MRIFFIHGLGENEGIFRHISQSIGNDQIFINLWDRLGNERQDDLNVSDFSKALIERYRITSADWVIGHSLGGWIAYHIKHHTGCRIVQIASFTNVARIVTPVRSLKIVYWLVRKNMYFNKFNRWLFAQSYNGLPSRQIFKEVFTNLINGNKECVINQLKLIFEPVAQISIEPDLRIHARKDIIVKYPTEPFYEVPGDHFTLFTYPHEVIKPIVDVLKKQEA